MGGVLVQWSEFLLDRCGVVGGTEVVESWKLRGQVLTLPVIPDCSGPEDLVPRDHCVNAAPAVVCALTSLFIFLNFSFLILTMLLILVTLQVNCEESMNNACEGLCEGSGPIQKSACRSFCFSEMAFCWFWWFELFPYCFVLNLQEWRSCLPRPSPSGGRGG